MRILFIVRALGIGGASKQLALTANAFAERGHTVSVYTYCSNAVCDKLSAGVRYIPSDVYGKRTEYLCAIPHIRQVVKREKPDVVISWRANAGCFTRLATIGLKCKVIYSERTDPYMETSAFLKFATWVCGFSDGGVFQTEMARDYYKRLAAKSTVIPNPFECRDLPTICPVQERRKEIACVGRFFMIQKRQDLLLEAFGKVRETFPDYKLVFYGDGVDMEKVKHMVKDRGLEQHVVFKGAVGNVIEEIRHSRLFVLSSDYEGIPNVILEAFAAGVPVVSTDCSPGGARVLIDNGRNGFIVPCRDSEAMAEKCVRLLADGELSGEFVENGRAKLKNFNYETIAGKWNDYVMSVKQKK